MSIEVITGCMFAGKTSTLLNRVWDARERGKNILTLKHSWDTRYTIDSFIVSHEWDTYTCECIKNVSEFISCFKSNNITEYDFIAIDEIQFFDESMKIILDKISKTGVEIVVAGLDMDYKQEPFEIMPSLMLIADKVTKLKAKCYICGEEARYTIRNSEDEKRILVGSSEYSAVCYKCLT